MIVGMAKDSYYMNLESAQRRHSRSTLIEQRGQAIKTTDAQLRLASYNPLMKCKLPGAQPPAHAVRLWVNSASMLAAKAPTSSWRALTLSIELSSRFSANRLRSISVEVVAGPSGYSDLIAAKQRHRDESKVSMRVSAPFLDLTTFKDFELGLLGG
jgi:hypothetical protein